MRPDRFEPAALDVIALPDNAPFDDDAEYATTMARLDDMRRTLGDEAFAAFAGKARDELEDLARREHPWPPTLAVRGLNTAMLLGFAPLERTCRQIAEDPHTADPDLARQAVQAATALLGAALKP